MDAERAIRHEGGGMLLSAHHLEQKICLPTCFDSVLLEGRTCCVSRRFIPTFLCSRPFENSSNFSGKEAPSFSSMNKDTCFLVLMMDENIFPLLVLLP